MAGEEVKHSTRSTSTCWKAPTCFKSCKARKNLLMKNVRAPKRLWEETAVCKVEHIILFRSHMVAHVLEAWNGVSMIQNPADGRLDIHLYSDVSGFFGCGA